MAAFARCSTIGEILLIWINVNVSDGVVCLPRQVCDVHRVLGRIELARIARVDTRLPEWLAGFGRDSGTVSLCEPICRQLK
jgi:hypothetical protein